MKDTFLQLTKVKVQEIFENYTDVQECTTQRQFI